ncbi:aspartyl protease family protein At5g10770 [Brachypodium distachyon]|uniref:Peptidase A1 domain-containing protein n=1 Tax=Brachypodium distachyon TaxID=15368 RepID=A0A2K2CTD9_BRADI|nr:aspartyl protease family protein At5g10770 [Brachypodium distachyon]PNT65287.1 hypothetical protein BRADI_4g39840v3 [Brachypodium distachyon]|eukprot:XP_024311058.1 aspartyl protease family protein At5g10770 [Brachypodium distachyon]
MEYTPVVLLVLALNCTFQSSSSASPGSSYGVHLNADGAFQFPVFHKYHPYLNSMVQAANIPDSAVIGDDSIRKNQFFMGISLGTPAVFNLVTIDTGSTISWVQCQYCIVHCYTQDQRAGPTFNTSSSSTYRRVGCSAQVCHDMHVSQNIPSGCVEEEDSCIYSLRYASGEYSAGYLSQDRLTLANSYSIQKFIFGCGSDNRYNGHSAGIIGFGNKSYSFFNQIAQLTNYSAFSYCFPSNQENEGFLSIGPYVRDSNKLILTQLFDYGAHLPVYALQQFDMMVNGMRLQVDPPVYTTRMTVVDSGTVETFVLSPVFRALDRALTKAMVAEGYVRGSDSKEICFHSNGDSVDWSKLPVVEIKFSRSILKLPAENVFYYETSDGSICSTFQPDDAGVPGVQILGNRATRSFRVVFDIQQRNFGFEAGAC